MAYIASSNTLSKVAVVTGGYKGFGFSSMKFLSENFKGDIYLTAGTVKLGRPALDKLHAEYHFADFHQLDITDDKSIDKLKTFLKAKYGGLDVLVNNECVQYKPDVPEILIEDAEHTVDTNYFGTLKVCHALFPLLRPHARVVNVCSCAGKICDLDENEDSADQELRRQLNDPNLTEENLNKIMQEFVQSAKDGTHSVKGWPNSAHEASKVGLSALTAIQQRQFASDEREDILLTAIHATSVDTDMSIKKARSLPLTEESESYVYCKLLPVNTLIYKPNPTVEEGYLLRISCADKPNMYWMLLTIHKDSTLWELDQFLRDMWLHCCTHLSNFMIYDDVYMNRPLIGEGNKSMHVKVGEIFTKGMEVDYMYDMGSTTELTLRVLDKIQSYRDIDILPIAQNDIPPYDCDICQKKAIIICSFCRGKTCKGCAKKHCCAVEEKETFMLMPLVNSPRTGVCAYTSSEQINWNDNKKPRKDHSDDSDGMEWEKTKTAKLDYDRAAKTSKLECDRATKTAKLDYDRATKTANLVFDIGM